MGADNWCMRNTLLRIQWQAIKLSLELAPHLGQGNWKSQNISRIWRDSSSRHKFDIFLYLKIVNMATLFGDLDVFFSNFFFFFYVYECIPWLCVCTHWVHAGASGSQERALDFLEPELQVVAGKWTHVLWKSSSAQNCWAIHCLHPLRNAFDILFEHSNLGTIARCCEWVGRRGSTIDAVIGQLGSPENLVPNLCVFSYFPDGHLTLDSFYFIRFFLSA